MEKLDLSETGLESIPESIGRMKRLRFLNLEGNQLKDLPNSIGNLKNLRELYLKDNQISKAACDDWKNRFPNTTVEC